jgi:putative ABC transport system permease protein
MRKVALRGLFSRKLRLVLTSLAVALGVTLIAGTYVFTDTINASFDRIFTESNKGTDASVTPKPTIDTSDNGGTAPTVSAAVLAKVRANPNVASADGSVFDQATVLDAKGKKLSSSTAPAFVASVADQPRFRGFTVKDGRLPAAPDEATIDRGTAKKKDLELGETIGISGTTRRQNFRLVGFTQVAGVDSFGGTVVVDLQLPVAQRILGKGTGFDQIQASAKPGVTPAQLRDDLKRELPRTVQVRTGKEEARSQSDDIRQGLGFLQTALLAFAGISLFVGAFIIFNTFSITVTQRMREFALLRTMGASRGQVLRSVITEGLVLGALGSLVGLGLGVVTALGLRALFKAVGLDLPSNGTVIESRTVIVSLLVGTIVTVLAGLAPALRATRVPPVAALREGAVPMTHGPSRKVTAIAALLTTAGVALMCIGLFAPPSSDSATISLMGGGAALTFLGVALLSPRLVRPLAGFVGAPIERMTGITGRLARENTMRQPGRTAVTAAALMIGVALVTFASIFAAGARDTIAKAVDDNLKGQLVVQNSDGFSSFSPAVLRTVARVPGVRETSPVRFSQAKVAGVKGNTAVSGIDPRTLPSVYKLQVKKGPADVVASLSGTSVLVGKGFVDKHGTQLGKTLSVTTPNGRRLQARVIGEVDDKGGLTNALIFDNATLQRSFGERKDAFGIVGLQPGADQGTVKAAVKRTLDRAFPEAEVLTAKEFKDDIAGQVNQLLYLIYALLALAIIVSLFGIVNTLVLSISERTRELGMLRAVGTSQRQVRRIVRYESVITSLIGCALGLVLGVILAILFTRPLDDFTLSIPIPTLIILLIAAGVAGVLAAVLPARRAAKLDVLEALAYE